jgi:hypothetical protein
VAATLQAQLIDGLHDAARPSRGPTLSGYALSVRWSAIVFTVFALGVTGCGGSNSGGGTASYRSQTSNSTNDALARLKKCVKRAGATIKPDPPPTKDRIAVGAAGNLPATYVGAIVWPNRAYMDVWIADDAAHGEKTAKRLNRAEARTEGVSEVEAAFNNGRAVAAPENNPDTFGKLPIKKAKAVDRCLAATNE